MFNMKQLFTKNYLLLSHIALFLVRFNSFEVIIRSQSLKVSKSYQNNQVLSIKKPLGVSNSLSLYFETRIYSNIASDIREFRKKI